MPLEPTIPVVLDTLATADDLRHVSAGQFLRSLTDLEYTELRKEQTNGLQQDATRFKCPMCNCSIYVRSSKNGLRHFAHPKGKGENCPWRSESGDDLREIDSTRFANKQESRAHKQLKNLLVEILKTDAAYREVSIEKVISKNGFWRKPDVCCINQHGEVIAFDIQLSTTHMRYIVERENFYKVNGIRYVWIAGSDETTLERQAFKDIYMSNDGQILSINGICSQQAKDNNIAHFCLFSLRPYFNGNSISCRWEKAIINREQINWGRPGDIPYCWSIPSFDDAMKNAVDIRGFGYLRSNLFEAVSKGDDVSAQDAWDQMATRVGGLKWNQLPEGAPTKCIGSILSVALNKKHVVCNFADDDILQIANTILLEGKNRRGWTHLFETVAMAVDSYVLNAATCQRKIERNKKTEDDLMQKIGPVFDAFFHWGAMRRLSR